MGRHQAAAAGDEEKADATTAPRQQQRDHSSRASKSSSRSSSTDQTSNVVQELRRLGRSHSTPVDHDHATNTPTTLSYPSNIQALSRALSSPAPSYDNDVAIASVDSKDDHEDKPKDSLQNVFASGKTHAEREAEAKKRKRSERKKKSSRDLSATAATSATTVAALKKPPPPKETAKSSPSPSRGRQSGKNGNERMIPSHSQSPSVDRHELLTTDSNNNELARSTSLPPTFDAPRGPFRLREFSVERDVPSQIDNDEETPSSSLPPIPLITVPDPSDPDPSRLALDRKAKQSFSNNKRRRARQSSSKRKWVMWGTGVTFIVLVVVFLILIFALDVFSSDNKASRQIPTPSPTSPTIAPVVATSQPTTTGETKTPTLAPSTMSPTFPTLTRTDLYCFPPIDRRLQFALWDDLLLQVKQDLQQRTCGPEDNRFSRSMVLVDQAAQTLTLRYARQQSSEVRVVLPGDQVFTYGTFSFSVQSVKVYDSTGNILSNTLPPEIVLGLFTWDDEEAYLTNQNYHHEVDIEISRWNVAQNADVQFLVQQSGLPAAHRFYSGRDGASSYQQGGHWYNFTWNPGRIDWNTTAGGGQEITLTTAKAVQLGETDYIQCLPGKQVDVRMNLWNMMTARNIPAGYSFFDTVEVVIDKFVYTPSGLEHVEEGGACSKDCQCAPDFVCRENRCAPVQADPDYVPPTPPRPSTPFYCGCSLCVQAIWDTPAQTIYQTCGERIRWYQRAFPDLYPTEEEACGAVAEEFPCACGRCLAPTCPTNLDVIDAACAPTAAPTATFQPTTLTDLFTEDLYCFPEPQDRVEFTLFDDILVQVKESRNALCGPGENDFEASGVSETDTGTLGMRFTQGVASEVRLLLPNSRLPYGYGTFAFQVESVSVRRANGNLLSDVLPEDLVLAMFTWEESGDPADYKSEIAIQLSRAGVQTNPDLVFVLQPAGYLRTYRYFTGGGNSYSQGGHWYNITWLPGRIEWSTDAAGGVSTVVTTEQYVEQNQPDHIRCPPSRNLEVRLNLWNRQGRMQPTGLAFTDVVEVEIGQFVFEPASVSTMQEGNTCSKDCQCPQGTSCVQNICTSE